MENITKRGRGRPKLGNVLFARRVSPARIPEILELLKKDVATATRRMEALGGPRTENYVTIPESSEPVVFHGPQFGIAEKDHLELKDQLVAMTKSYEDCYAELQVVKADNEVWEKRREKWLAASDDVKMQFWISRALKAEAMLKGKGSEYDQTQG